MPRPKKLPYPGNTRGLGGVFDKLKLNLNKKITSNKSASEVLDMDFSELIKSGIPVEVRKFFEIYKELFYKINKRNSPNKHSHHDLIHESISYVNNFIDFCLPDLYTEEVIYLLMMNLLN